MVGRQRTDHGTEDPQLRLRGADPEQTAILLHHVDAGAPIGCIDHQLHRAIRRKDVAQRLEANIRVRQVVKDPRTNNLIEGPAELMNLLDREPMEIEVMQVIFPLQIARVAQAGFTDVDCRHLRVRFAQCMDRGLRRAAAGDQNLTAYRPLLCRPQQKSEGPTPIRVPIEFAVPLEIDERLGVGMALVKGAHLVHPLANTPPLGGRGRGGGEWLDGRIISLSPLAGGGVA
jgi:hypothetical protein